MQERLNYLYVGVDPHKRQHTAVALDFFRQKACEVTFENKPSAYPKMVGEISNYAKEKGLTVIFGLEDTANYGRNLTIYLIQEGFTVREVSSKLSSAKRKSHNTVRKSDSWDAECIAAVLIEEFDRLPTAKPVDHYWAIAQLVSRRHASMKGLEFTKKKLHAQLGHHYSSYRKFFTELDGKTALGFFYRFPSPKHLEAVGVQEFAEFLRKLSNNACSTKKAEEILSLVKADGELERAYQEQRDFIVRSIVNEIRFHKREIARTEREIKPLMEGLGYKLDTMTGIDLVSAASFVAEIGDIGRFASANQLARYAGIAPVDVSSGGKVKHAKTNQGNRVLHELFFQLACPQLALSRRHHEPRNPMFLEYFQKKQAEGKTKGQAIVCVMRKLVNIVYKMMKNKTEYVLHTSSKEKVV